MVVLLDTNVIINFITNRDDPFSDACKQLVTLCVNGDLIGFMAFHSLSTIWYLIRKWYGEAEARFWLAHLCGAITVTGAEQWQIQAAIQNQDFRDFEDCLQDECAMKVGADYLVTCNMKDYKNAKTKVVSPSELISILDKASEKDS